MAFDAPPDYVTAATFRARWLIDTEHRTPRRDGGSERRCRLRERRCRTASEPLPPGQAARLLRGRDDDAPRALHRRRDGGRRDRDRRDRAARDRVRARAGLRGGGRPLAGRRAAERLHRRQLHPGHDHAGRRHVGEAGKTIAYVRKRNPAFAGEKPDEFVAISTRCAHLGCPVRWVERRAALRVPLSRRRLRLPGRGRRAARRCGRSTASRRGSRTGRSRSGRATASTRELKRFSPRDPGEPLDGLWQYLYPKRFTTPPPSADGDPDPKAAAARLRRKPPPPRASSTNGEVAGQGPGGRGRRRRRRLGRRAHRRERLPARASCSARSRRGPTGSTRSARRRCSRSCRRRSPGVFLAMYYDPIPTRAYDSVQHITNDVFLGALVRGMHRWGATRDDRADLPAHGARLLLRRLQVPARAELGGRRRAAGADAGDGPHRLPAAVRPALVLGHGRGA